jgi:hypothetical protein
MGRGITIEIELYDGPAVRRTGATHQITVFPDESTGVPELEFMRPGVCFRNEDGPYLEIVAAVVDRQVYTGRGLGRSHEIRHVYLAKEVRF